MTSHDLNRAFEAFAPTAEQEQASLPSRRRSDL